MEGITLALTPLLRKKGHNLRNACRSQFIIEYWGDEIAARSHCRIFYTETVAMARKSRIGLEEAKAGKEKENESPKGSGLFDASDTGNAATAASSSADAACPLKYQLAC